MRNETLDSAAPYASNALELRQKHIANIEQYLPVDDVNRVRFLKKHKPIVNKLLSAEAACEDVTNHVSRRYK